MIGCSTAYYLAKLGWKDVFILERKQLTSGTTWHAAGLEGEFYFPEDGRANLVDATMSLAKGARELAGPLKNRFVQFLLNNPEPLLYFGEMIYRNGKQVAMSAQVHTDSPWAVRWRYPSSKTTNRLTRITSRSASSRLRSTA